MLGYCFLVIVMAFSTASGQGGPCAGVPNSCIPIGHVPYKTCITPANNGGRLSWYQIENMCKQNDGRLVWLSDDLDLDHLLITRFRRARGSFVVTGLLSTTDKAGLFWRNINDSSTFQCNSDKTDVCASTNSSDECGAIGCCWREGTCHYPYKQNLTIYSVNETISNISSSTERQCVGYQLNANSSKTGQWVSYDCFTTIDNAEYVCEYKCNVPDWPDTNMTSFQFGDTIPQAPTTNSPLHNRGGQAPTTDSSFDNGGNQEYDSTPNVISPSDNGGTHVNNLAPATNSPLHNGEGQALTTGSPSGNGGNREYHSIPLACAYIMFLLISMMVNIDDVLFL